MTANQINWQNMLINRDKQQEDVRHNTATETEINRHNLQTEAVDLGNLAESSRHNKAYEVEMNRSNLAREQETHRANMANEANNRYGIDIGYLGTRYVADSNRAAAKYTADSNLAGTKYTADRNYSLGMESNRISALRAEYDREYKTDQNRIAQLNSDRNLTQNVLRNDIDRTANTAQRLYYEAIADNQAKGNELRAQELELDRQKAIRDSMIAKDKLKFNYDNMYFGAAIEVVKGYMNGVWSVLKGLVE